MASRKRKSKRLNIKKTNPMISGKERILKQTIKYSCGVCMKGVRGSSVLCTGCQKWCHKRCSGLENLNEAGEDFKCPTCVNSETGVRYPCGCCGNGVGANSVLCTTCQKWCHKKCSRLKHMKDAGNKFRCPTCVRKGAKDPEVLEERESFINKVIADIPLIQKEPYIGGVFNKQENTESLLLTIGQIKIDENEAIEVPSTSTGLNVTQTRDVLSVSPPPRSSFYVDVNSTTQHLLSSHSCEKFVGDIEDKPRNPENAPQFQNLIALAVHKAPVIIPSVLYNLKDQSQIKGDITASTSEDSHKQNIAKKYSEENPIDKKHIKNSNESIKDKMSKTDKKNEKLKVGENYDRINYLVQASRKLFKNDKSVSSQLGSLAISFGRRLPQVRLDPLLKREMCKGCGVYLVYGVNAKVRHRSKRQKHLVVTCMTCRTIKRFVTNPKHKLWSEQPEAQVN